MHFMKIGYCLSNFLMGGVQTVFANLANEVKKTQDVKYCLLSKDASDPLVADMFKSIECVSHQELLEWSDIIHLDGMNMKEQRKLFKKKWMHTIQFIGSAGKKVTWLNKHLYSSNIVVDSKYVQKTLKGLRREPRVIYDSVDIEKFRPLNIEKKYDLAFLGRLRPIKNPGLFLEICDKGNFSFIIIGGTHRRNEGKINEFEKMARSQLHEGCDFITGFVSHYDVPKFVNQARMTVATSHSEAIGLNCLESMACGVPVVSRQVGGNPEALGEDSDLLVPYDAPAEVYVEKIRKYINNGDLPDLVRQRIINNFSFEKSFFEYMRFYKDIYGGFNE
jgi:glycosyltransferase involved in cell wall biosynthesis